MLPFGSKEGKGRLACRVPLLFSFGRLPELPGFGYGPTEYEFVKGGLATEHGNPFLADATVPKFELGRVPTDACEQVCNPECSPERPTLLHVERPLLSSSSDPARNGADRSGAPCKTVRSFRSLPLKMMKS